MSDDPSQPKGEPSTQAESPTRAFSLKLDGWMAELAKQDLGLDADAKPPEAAAEPGEAAAPPAAEAAPEPPPEDAPKS